MRRRRSRMGPAIGVAAIVAVGACCGGAARADRLDLPKFLEPQGSIEAVYRLDGPATGSGFLDVEWRDTLGRIVAWRRIPLNLHGASQIAFPLDLARAVAVENRLTARLSLETPGPGAKRTERTGEAEASFIVTRRATRGRISRSSCGSHRPSPPMPPCSGSE
jgi:hypothetical protein